jgi:hypothetical protein
MPLTAGEIATAESMHEFVHRYKDTYNPRKVFMVYCGGLLSCLLLWLRFIGPERKELTFALLGFGVGIALLIVVMHLALSFRYRQSLILLGILEREHADQLYWVGLEKEIKGHQAAVQELEQELANRQAAT